MKTLNAAGNSDEHRIIPFRGEYYKIAPERQFLVHNLIYPVPDPTFPFLGVHFTRMAKGGVEAGPNAVLALAREGYHHTDINLGDLWRTASFKGFWAMAGNIGKPDSASFTAPSTSRLLSARCKSLCRKFAKAILFRAAPACAPRPCQPAARWWTTLLSKKAATPFTSSMLRPRRNRLLAIGQAITDMAAKNFELKN